MNRKLLLLLALLLFSYGLLSCSSDDNSPSEGEQTDTPELFTKRYNPDQSFYSKILGQEIKYSVLLPQEYLSESTGKYGVVFLLHGWGGNQSSWGPSGLNIQSIADAQTSNGSIRPLIYIMPEGFNSYFCNRYDGKFNYMDMFINELVPLIDKRFRTTASKTERAVAGFSMGGFGALSIASQHPETFSVSIGLSPSLNTDEQYISLSQDGWNLQWGNNFGGSGQTGTGRLTSYYKSQCPLHFFKDKPSSTFQTVRYYIDCGDDEERLYAGNGELHSLLRDKNIKHEYRVRNGAHTDSYWRESMKEALPFIERSFKGENYPQETLKKFTEELHATNKNIKVGNSNIELWLPDDYNSELTYKVLYYSMYGNDELKMPLVSTGALCDYIAGRDVKNKAAMLELLQKLQQLWQLPEGECLQQLQDICTAFNSHRLDTTAVAQILLFEEVPQVFEYIKQQIWCEEVFYEDFGCSYSWLEKLCQSFTNGSFFRYRLLHFLNDRVGCLAG